MSGPVHNTVSCWEGIRLRRMACQEFIKKGEGICFQIV
nr:MAG TPA: hypothetical protein [Caudoviricetes sp.]